MSRPRLRTEGTLLPGLAAVGLFVVLAVVFVGTGFPTPAGFASSGEAPALMRSLGAALFSIDASAVAGDASPIASEGFIVAFEIIDIALVAALVGAVMLARREESGENVTVGTTGQSRAVSADGGVSGGEDA